MYIQIFILFRVALATRNRKSQFTFISGSERAVAVSDSLAFNENAYQVDYIIPSVIIMKWFDAAKLINVLENSFNTFVLDRDIISTLTSQPAAIVLSRFWCRGITVTNHFDLGLKVSGPTTKTESTSYVLLCFYEKSFFVSWLSINVLQL